MPADPNDRYLAAYAAAYGADDLKGRPAEQLDAIREEMMAVEEASDDEVAARFLTAIGYGSMLGPGEPLLEDVRKMRAALGIPAPMSDADRVQVALSTAEARVEELEGEVVRLKKDLADLSLRLRVAKMDRTAVPGWEPNAHGGWLCMGGEVPRLTSVNPVPDSSPLRWWIVEPHDFRLDYEREADGDPTYNDALDAINAATLAAKEPR